MQTNISVVIPTYNYGKFVCQAVDSVLAQTCPPLEIIVVDDGSTDNTRELLKTYGNRIQYIYQENRHLSAARNTGIRAAKGEWIAFLDSDDLWHPQKLERISNIITTHPELSAVSTDGITFQDQPPAVKAIFSGAGSLIPIGLRELVYGVPFSGGSSAIVKRECLIQVGLFKETLRSVEDLDMWLRLAAHYRLMRLGELLTIVRVHPTSMSAQAERMEANHRKMLSEVFAAIPELRRHPFWKMVAYARLHRGVAMMHAEAGNRSAAFRSLWRSFLACPLTSGNTALGVRLRMAIHFLLGK